MGASDPAASLSPASGPYSYEHEGDRQFATTLARGLEVLRCFTPLEPTLGNKEKRLPSIRRRCAEACKPGGARRCGNACPPVEQVSQPVDTQ